MADITGADMAIMAAMDMASSPTISNRKGVDRPDALGEAANLGKAAYPIKSNLIMNTAMERSEAWDLIIKPQQSFFQLDLKDIWRYRDLLWLFVRRDFVSFYKQTILGPLWFFIQPLFTTLIYTFVFGGLANIPSTDCRCRFSIWRALRPGTILQIVSPRRPPCSRIMSISWEGIFPAAHHALKPGRFQPDPVRGPDDPVPAGDGLVRLGKRELIFTSLSMSSCFRLSFC